MRIGLQVTNFTWPNHQESLGETFGLIAQRAERAGLFSFWVMDHFFQIPGVGPAEHEMLEGYSALAFAAAQTNRIKLGTMVTGVTYRYPGLLVKTVTTLDVLSGGRAYLGIGAGWYEEEHRGLGVPFPPLAERFEHLEETLEIAHQMWKGDEKPYQGNHYQLARPLNSPSSIQKPHPPIFDRWGRRAQNAPPGGTVWRCLQFFVDQPFARRSAALARRTARALPDYRALVYGHRENYH